MNNSRCFLFIFFEGGVEEKERSDRLIVSITDSSNSTVYVVWGCIAKACKQNCSQWSVAKLMVLCRTVSLAPPTQDDTAVLASGRIESYRIKSKAKQELSRQSLPKPSSLFKQHPMFSKSLLYRYLPSYQLCPFTRWLSKSRAESVLINFDILRARSLQQNAALSSISCWKLSTGSASGYPRESIKLPLAAIGWCCWWWCDWCWSGIACPWWFICWLLALACWLHITCDCDCCIDERWCEW